MYKIVSKSPSDVALSTRESCCAEYVVTDK